MKVFLADDSKTFIERFTRLVTDLPEVELVGKAGDVPGAIRGIRNLLPDAVIVDFHMPGGTGIDIIDAAKRFRSTTTVIVLTNSHYPQYRARCQAAGADAFFDKSTEFDRVPEALLELSEEFRQPHGPAVIKAKPPSRPASRAGGPPPESSKRGEICHRAQDPRRARPILDGSRPGRGLAFPGVPAAASAGAQSKSCSN
jgi:DNA-binding NarL/FixJ family response regulator